MTRTFRSAWLGVGLGLFLIGGAPASWAGEIRAIGIGDSGITTSKIANGAVTTNKLAKDAVTEVKILAGAVTTDKLGTDAVTNAKLLSDSASLKKVSGGAAVSDGTNIAMGEEGGVPRAKLDIASGAFLMHGTIPLNYGGNSPVWFDQLSGLIGGEFQTRTDHRSQWRFDNGVPATGYLCLSDSGSGSCQTNSTAGSWNLFSNSAHSLHLGAGGAVGLTMLPTSLNVGIGTTAPASSLSVGGAGTVLGSIAQPVIVATGVNDKSIAVQGGTSGAVETAMRSVLLRGQFGTTTDHQTSLIQNGNEYLTVISGGNVGIGTTNPAYIVTSSASAASFAMYTDGSDGNQRNWVVKIQNDAAGDFGILRSLTPSGAPTSRVLMFDSSGNASFRGNVGTGDTVTTLPFQVHTSSLVVASGGNVGIGTTNPTSKLYITANDSAQPAVLIDQTGPAAGSSRGLLIYAGGNASDYGLLVKDRAGNDKVEIDGLGNVGIGTTNPAQKLDISGPMIAHNVSSDTFRMKGAATTRNTATQAEDTDFTTSLTAGSTYHVTAHIHAQTDDATNADLDIYFLFSQLASTITFHCDRTDLAAPATVDTYEFSSHGAGAEQTINLAGTGEHHLFCDGVFEQAPTAGTIKLYWARSGGSGNLTLGRTSYIKYQEVARIK